ncbi:MAG: VTT domain-containing protein [Actinomycetota bacterium]|nr:VTT domain-containing protein [Actinomycetota bacterium]
MSTTVLGRQSLRAPATRKTLLAVAAVRAVLAVVALPLVPLLFQDHFLVLVLLRPAKEIFLAGGFLARQGDVNLGILVLAAIPLSIFGVWHFFLLGRAYSSEINAGELSGVAARVLTPGRVERLQRSLARKGPKLIFLGRLAVLSSAAVATAAGAAKMEPGKFFPWDLGGGLLSIVYTIGAGWFLGAAYEKAGPWITIAGVVALLGFAFVLGRTLQRDA